MSELDDIERLENLIEKGNLKAIKKLLDEGAAKVQLELGRDQPIHWAAANNKPKVVEFLIGYGADPNIPDQEGRTPLHRAAEMGVETVRMLLRHKADPNNYDIRGYTPFTWAVSGAQPEGKKIAKMLQQAGAEYDLTAAIAMGDVTGVRDSLAKDKSAISKFSYPETLLSLAWTTVIYGEYTDRVEIVSLLLKNGLTLPKKTILHHAEASKVQGFNEISDLLRKHVKR